MPDANMFVEKRAHPRISAKIHVKYRLIEDQKEIDSVFELRKREQTSQSMDLSLGGLYLVSEQLLNVGSILRLDLSLPGQSDPLSAFAEVVWANPTGGGLRFLAMKEKDREALKAYLNRLTVSS